jgi:hypothetical protein
MTPKEKAKELVDKFCPLVTTWDCYNDSSRDDEDIIIDAKQCALIAVNEILKQCFDYRDIVLQASYDYWTEVKSELEKIN